MGKGFFSTHCPRLPAGFGPNLGGGRASLFPEMAPKDLWLGTASCPFIFPAATPSTATFQHGEAGTSVPVRPG